MLKFFKSLWIFLYFASSLFLAIACNNTLTNKNMDKDSFKRLDFETIEKGDHSFYSSMRGKEGVLNEVTAFTFNNQDEFNIFWSRHKAGIVRKPQAPVFDFKTNTLIAVIDKVEPSGGIELTINGIKEFNDYVYINISKIVPGQDSMVSAVITQPFHIVQIKKNYKKIKLNLNIKESNFY